MENKAYPESWYAASCDMGPPFPGLETSLKADVCVIGGGYTGLSAALALAEAGTSVVLLEARRIGWGASGRNGGQLIHGFVGYEKMLRRTSGKDRERVRELKWAGHDLIKQRIKRYDIDCDFSHGWLELAPSARQFSALRKQYESYLKSDAEKGWALFDKSDVEAVMGSSVYEGGVLSHGDAHVHPLKLCRGLRDACLRLGVKIFEESPVTGVQAGSKPEVMTAHGKVAAQDVILAANAHHSVMRKAFSGYAYAAGSFVMVTEPLAPHVLTQINPQQLAFCDTRKVCDYYRTTRDGRVLFGGRVNYSGRKPASIEAVLRPRLLKIWPQLEGVKSDFEWGGKLAVPMAQSPLVGTINEHIHYAFGYTGHGVNTANLLGKVVADALLGDRASFDLFASMPKWRLPVGACVGQQMVAAAIFYYKITDAL